MEAKFAARLLGANGQCYLSCLLFCGFCSKRSGLVKKKALSQNGAFSLAFDALRQCAGRALALNFAALQSDGVF